MKNFIENHRHGIILSSVLLPIPTIVALAVALLRDTNQLFLDYSMVWYCLAQLVLIAVASTTTRSDLQKLLIGCSLLLLLMTIPINYVIAIVIPGSLLLVLGLLRLYKPVNLLVALAIGVVLVIGTGQCIAWHSGRGLEFAITSVSSLVCSYIIAWCVYCLSRLVSRFPEPVRRFITEDY